MIAGNETVIQLTANQNRTRDQRVRRDEIETLTRIAEQDGKIDEIL